ncbi:MAG TPA: two-component system response regulator [Legionella sp.]|nr:two-component system response regulator [Legionella sp.]
MTKRRILIVDDNQGIRESVAYLLESEGFHVSIAVDGYDAIERLKEGVLPCWIMMDLTMPRMGGEKCLEHIRCHSDWKDIPITLVSASGRIKEQAMAHHVDYLQKPFEIDSLLATVKRHCG